MSPFAHTDARGRRAHRRQSAASAELRALRHPGATFRELIQEPRGGPWVFWRRPLLLLFAMGCVVSLQASGRMSVRLIVDGAVSFAFVPASQILAVAAVYWLGRHPIPFTRAVDLSFVANGPWLLWLLAFSTLRAVETPRQATAPPEWLLWTVLASIIPIAVWAAYIDFHVFRDVLARPAPGARRAVILQRLIGWSAALLYFFVYVIESEIARFGS